MTSVYCLGPLVTSQCHSNFCRRRVLDFKSITSTDLESITSTDLESITSIDQLLFLLL